MSDVGRCPKHDELLEIEIFGTTPLCRSCLREPKPGTPEGLSIKFTREFETDAASPNYQQTKATKWEVSPERAELQVSLLNALGSQLAEQAETLKTYKLSLEGIQGLLVGLEAMFEPMATEIDHVAKRYSEVATRLAQIEGRLDNAMGKFIWLDARGEARLATALEAIGKPRKAGKRPVRKAKVTHKTL